LEDGGVLFGWSARCAVQSRQRVQLGVVQLGRPRVRACGRRGRILRSSLRMHQHSMHFRPLRVTPLLLAAGDSNRPA